MGRKIFQVTLIATLFLGLFFVGCKKDPTTTSPPVVKPVVDSTPFVLSVSVYPNPCTGIFTVKTNDTNPDTVIISNIVGQIKFNQAISGTTMIDIVGLPAGIYFVDVFSGKNKAVKKLIVQ